MFANETVEAKKAYIKPQLATHGSVQQLTEGGKHDRHDSHDCGSNIKLPTQWTWGDR